MIFEQERQDAINKAITAAKLGINKAYLWRKKEPEKPSTMKSLPSIHDRNYVGKAISIDGKVYIE